MNVRQLQDRLYPPDTMIRSEDVLRELIYANTGPSSRVLDAGAGAGLLFKYELKGRVAEIVGVDLDPRVETNPQLDRGVCSDMGSIPVSDGYFDLVISRAVLEHISDPDSFLREINRVLKPGGMFLFLTPNKWHYVILFSRMTPHWFHEWYNERVRGRGDNDTFPAVYLLNSVGDVRRRLGKAGFLEDSITLRESCPNYLLFSLPAFLLGAAYERIVNSSSLFSRLRANLLGQFRKAPS